MLLLSCYRTRIHGLDMMCVLCCYFRGEPWFGKKYKKISCFKFMARFPILSLWPFIPFGLHDMIMVVKSAICTTVVSMCSETVAGRHVEAICIAH